MIVRVATFNLESLDDDARRAPPVDARITVLRPQLERLEADVLCLQEVNSQRDEPHGPRTLRALDRLLEGTAYASFERVCTVGPKGWPIDVHNLVVLSRFPIRAHAQHKNDVVAPPRLALTTASSAGAPVAIEWDRAILHVEIALPTGDRLHVLDAHLRAPIAAAIEGQKLSASAWRTARGWAEGYFVSAVKRTGQALELRLLVDALLDRDPGALIAVAGDLNADSSEVPLRMLRATVDDTGNRALAGRALVPLEERVDPERRYTVLHDGRRVTLDHVLASVALAAGHRRTAIHNEHLADEHRSPSKPIASFHAPVVVELAIGERGDRA